METRKVVPELSVKEKERRWSLLRAKLKKAGLSALIVYGGTQLGVPVHYLTRVWGSKFNAVLFPTDGDPLFFIPSNTPETGQSLAAQGCWIPAENVHLTANLPRDLAQRIKDLKLQKSRIGIDSLRFWPAQDYLSFSELCPAVQLVEAHRLFGEIRGPKSSEELAAMENAIRISDLAHYAFMLNLRPGMTETEAARCGNDVLEAHGAGDRIILIHNRPEMTSLYFPGETAIERQSTVLFSPEFTLKQGYGAQMIRGYAWEAPKGVQERMYALCGELRQMVAAEFRPGVEITRAGQKIEDLVASWGFECDKLGHAVGLSYGDAPYITANEDERDYMAWTILENEVYVVHPMIRGKGGKPPFAMTGDMFVIGKDRTTWMTTALPELPVILPR
jgi:Xaa-Pro aminopeptidase